MAEGSSPAQPPLWRPQPRRAGRPPVLFDSLASSASSTPEPLLPADDAFLAAHPLDPATATTMASPKRPSVLNLAMTSARDEQAESPTDGSSTPQRSRSILNLTASTLLGIYAPSSSSADRRQSSSSSLLMDSNDPQRTPWGTGSQTPLEPMRPAAFPGPASRSANGVSSAAVAAKLQQDQRLRRPAVSSVELAVASILRVALLAFIGVTYGAFITHLHDNQGLAPVRVDIERRNIQYLGFWGGLAVLLGAALPYVDGLVTPEAQQPARRGNQTSPKTLERLGAEWNPLVRSVGAFVGIAFAIRKLPWQSTQQLSLTLALVNPCIWYLVDRTRSGFVMSTMTAVIGASFLMTFVPGIIPQPHVAASARGLGDFNWWKGAFGGSGETASIAGDFEDMRALQGVGIATWTGSVLFCSSVFFGNVGRKVWENILS